METPTNGTVVPKFDRKDIDDNAMAAAISYVSVLAFVILIFKKDSPFAQEHAKQGVVLFIAEIIISILSLLPIIGWFIIGPIGTALMIILSIIGFLKALNGEFWEIPFFGQYRHQVKL